MWFLTGGWNDILAVFLFTLEFSGHHSVCVCVSCSLIKFDVVSFEGVRLTSPGAEAASVDGAELPSAAGDADGGQAGGGQRNIWPDLRWDGEEPQGVFNSCQLMNKYILYSKCWNVNDSWGSTWKVSGRIQEYHSFPLFVHKRQCSVAAADSSCDSGSETWHSLCVPQLMCLHVWKTTRQLSAASWSWKVPEGNCFLRRSSCLHAGIMSGSVAWLINSTSYFHLILHCSSTQSQKLVCPLNPNPGTCWQGSHQLSEAVSLMDWGAFCCLKQHYVTLTETHCFEKRN